MQSSYSNGDLVLIKKCFNSFSQNDVVYFEYPIKDSSQKKIFFTQRIVALPGDSFELVDKTVFINSKAAEQISGIKHNYFIKTNEQFLDSSFLAAYGIDEGGGVSDSYDYSYSLTDNQCENLKKDSLIKSVELKIEKADAYDEMCFPGNLNFRWNMDQFGKIYVPKKNDVLELDTVSLYLYKKIIVDYENNTLELQGDSIFINGEMTHHYLVKQNYYFMLGDNRDNAVDSRTWGFLPEKFINGKVEYRLRKAKK